ncbi:MAG: trypsin-like peptidase domain-containing protein [Myxococcota bacterium]
MVGWFAWSLGCGSPVPLPGPAPTPTLDLARLPDIAESALRSVAFVTTRRSLPGAPQPPGLLDLPESHHRTEVGEGSAVVVREDGALVTSNHVIQGTSDVTVRLADGTVTSARVVASDPQTDVAVLQLRDVPPGLVPIRFGDSDDLRVGQVVLAVGNPFGVGQTVTMGIVSALGRARLGLVDYEDFIQTDAAINPGNSGGALVNLDGELVGIVTAIWSNSGGSDGVGFAVPSNLARQVSEMLLETGRVDRGWLGASLQEVSPALRVALAPAIEGGVVVTDVQTGSPAAFAGLVPGDVIVSLDGRPVRDPERVRTWVAAAGPGAPFSLEVVGRDQTSRVVSGALSAVPSPSARATLVAQGVKLDPVTESIRIERNLPRQLRGLLVVAVDPAGRLAGAGLLPGDVILDLDHRPIETTAAFTAGFDDAGQQPVLLRIWRDGTIRFVAG